MMEMGELVRHYLLAILVRDYNLNKISSTVNKGAIITNGANGTFWTQILHLKNR